MRVDLTSSVLECLSEYYSYLRKVLEFSSLRRRGTLKQNVALQIKMVTSCMSLDMA